MVQRRLDMLAAARARRLRRHCGFTLIELVAVIVIIAILVGIALPRYTDHSAAAMDAADTAAIGAINAALRLAYMDHRMTEAPASQWINDVDDIASIMNQDMLPGGITIVAGKIVDQRGFEYSLTPETAEQAGTLIQD